MNSSIDFERSVLALLLLAYSAAFVIWGVRYFFGPDMQQDGPLARQRFLDYQRRNMTVLRCFIGGTVLIVGIMTYSLLTAPKSTEFTQMTVFQIGGRAALLLVLISLLISFMIAFRRLLNVLRKPAATQIEKPAAGSCLKMMRAVSRAQKAVLAVFGKLDEASKDIVEASAVVLTSSQDVEEASNELDKESRKEGKASESQDTKSVRGAFQKAQSAAKSVNQAAQKADEAISMLDGQGRLSSAIHLILPLLIIGIGSAATILVADRPGDTFSLSMLVTLILIVLGVAPFWHERLGKGKTNQMQLSLRIGLSSFVSGYLITEGIITFFFGLFGSESVSPANLFRGMLTSAAALLLIHITTAATSLVVDFIMAAQQVMAVANQVKETAHHLISSVKT